MTTKNVAIACQGGGTHAAFTWGVLTQILDTKRKWDAEVRGHARFDISAISGTSAGALCALAAWYGLVPNSADPECGTIGKAIERLNHLWTTFAAEMPIEKTHDKFVAAMLQLKEHGVPFPETSPYAMLGDLAYSALALLGAREQYLGFPALLDALCPHFADIDWPQVAKLNRRCLAGAIEIYSGNFEVFDSDKTLEELSLRPSRDERDQYDTTRWKMRRSLSLEGVAASGTLPQFLKAQRIPDKVFPTCTRGRTVRRDAYYWDGLYSQNPPVRQILEGHPKDEKPDEIWVIRINPQEIDPQHQITSLEDIRDRQNDLAGNLSLNQELDFILTVDDWLAKYGDDHPFLRDRKTIHVRTIKMRRETAWGMCHRSKLDRSHEHLENLRVEGREVAQQWLANWKDRSEDFECYPDDARYPEQA